jgi:hypothetical protein
MRATTDLLDHVEHAFAGGVLETGDNRTNGARLDRVPGFLGVRNIVSFHQDHVVPETEAQALAKLVDDLIRIVDVLVVVGAVVGIDQHHLEIWELGGSDEFERGLICSNVFKDDDLKLRDTIQLLTERYVIVIIGVRQPVSGDKQLGDGKNESVNRTSFFFPKV